jgi:SAM-dependent methyltransferase
LEQTVVLSKHAAQQRYQAEIADGVNRFLEPRRVDCPWCGSPDIAVQVTSPDVVQRKPGRFTLERCQNCRHIFQNPQLNTTGLDFYYRDAYDGLGAKSTERVFSLMIRAYRRRAEMVRPYTNPRTWLDVGTGHGHFCRTASEIWPETEFAGLDFGDSVLEAERRGWIHEAYRGSFPDLVDTLSGRYDVVSMHHYLEHTVEPLRELEAAAQILGRHGHLLIEVPDPESTMARLLGRHWQPWFQPQHLHLIPVGNLERALASNGFRVVAVDRARADMGFDFFLTAAVLLQALGPDPRLPWAAPAGLIDHLRRIAALALTPPALLAGLLLDLTVRPLLPHHSNTYRVLAERV